MLDVDGNATHSEEVTEQVSAHPEADDRQSMMDAYAAFGLDYPAEESEEVQEQEREGEPQDEHPPTDDEPVERQERKGITVKHNKEEVFIDEEKIPEYARKGLNYDKIEGRAKQYEQALDRIAKQQGFKDHADLVANLDRIEQQAIQRQQEQFDTLKQQIREDAENAGLDPELVDQYLENHPALQQAREVLEKDKLASELRKQEEESRRQTESWEALFRKYPQLLEQTNEDGSAAWMTPELESRIRRGYDPIDAYELVYRDNIIADERRRAEQATLKQQRLNKRADVLKDSGAKLEPQAPEELMAGFALFGIDPKKAQKYAKNFE
ncbi:hypothetical protein J27TS7_58700 [Paenibacillus dendritiformis]|uniref:hypothetical protein n=1 Tax=Paenibacillus dendritiformis TaxID=130049 RepID=UPI001B295319|nr:hypothetical protein [Paenibacillus dendritiformis]GIO76356.1 hypothetical protein J27TS7_58700 [Paenibacillus dendritiformis]